MRDPHACTECLRRAWLLALLGPHVERAVADGAASRAVELLRLDNEDLTAAVAPAVAEQLLARIAGLGEQQLRAELDGAGCFASCRHDSRYPEQLREAADAPWALIGRGDPGLLAELDPGATVAVVGARRATAYGREVARTLGRDLAAAGLPVISGLAFGVDACAHRGALDGGGRTVAVLGCGPDVAYPAANRSLWRRITESGLVLSELPPGAAPWRWTFPARNRIIAGLAGITVVVEAAARSGSLHAAGVARDLGRALGAVPGPLTSRASAGANDLIAEGARLIRGAEDVLEALAGTRPPRGPRWQRALSPAGLRGAAARRLARCACAVVGDGPASGGAPSEGAPR